MIVNCDKCNSMLTDKDIELQTEEVSNDSVLVLRTIYYRTPCCNTKNIVAYENKCCDILKQDISNARRLNDTRRLKSLVNKLKIEMDRLKKLHCNK